MTLYAITKGEYSDYRICALTANKAKAERLSVLYSDSYDDARIEEYEDGEGEDVRVLWRCGEDGSNPELFKYDRTEGVYEDIFGDPYAIYVFAKDASHAEKKAHDMLSEYRAKKAGLC